MRSLLELAERRKVLVCVIHLPPLPGAPRWTSSVDVESLVDFAVNCAREAEEGGADAVIVENYGDNPFSKRVTDPLTIASMTVIVREVVKSVSVPVGVNLLRNSCPEAVAIAYAAGASFIRCNMYCEVAVCPEGLVEPVAHEVIKLKTYLRTGIEVLADILVKHATPLHKLSLRDLVEDCVARCLADAIIVTGSRTGEPPDPDLLNEILRYSRVPVFVGSGITPQNIKLYRAAHGFIVGTYIKREKGMIDRQRVQELKRAIAELQ